MGNCIRILFFIGAVSLCAGERPVAIGILEFQGGSGVSAVDARTVTEVFRSELVTSGFYTVLERGRMDEILKEQQFQQTFSYGTRWFCMKSSAGTFFVF